MESSRSYCAVIGQLSRSCRMMLVCGVSFDYMDGRAVVAVGWFVSSDSFIAQITCRYRELLVRVRTDPCCTISNTCREDSNTWREIPSPTPNGTTWLLKRVSRTYRAVIAQLS